MSFSLPNRSLFGRRLTVSVIAILLVALTATSVAAQPALDATIIPEQQSEITAHATLAVSPAMEPLSPPAGSLDPTFDGDGKVTTNFGNGASGAIAAALQSDGKIVVAGYFSPGSGGNSFALARYNGDGSLDTGFDGDGKVITSFSGSSAGGDLGPALGSTHLGAGKVGTWLRFDVTEQVQRVVAGVSPNYGFVVTSEDDTWDPTEAINGVRYGLATSEYWDASKAGYLRVMYRTFTE